MLVAILLTSSNADAAWIVFGAVAIVALAMSAAAGRARPRLGNAASGGEATASGLPVSARDVFERLPDPLMLLDASERVVFANRAMRAVIGVDAERKHVSSLLRTPAVLEAVRRSAARGEPTSVEFTFPVPIQRTYQAYIARIAGGPVATILLLHDLTAMKRAEQMRADFVANASHELRTPLAALSGFIDTLKGHARDDMAAREQFLGIMTVEAERMRRLIDDLLSLTRIEQNEHVPPSGETSLETVLREAMATLMPLAKAEGISLEMAAAPGMPPVAGERDELIQIFQNLIHNAIKYGKPGGHVWLSLGLAAAPGGRGAEQMLAAGIRDDGEGIPQNAVPRLTERFYRVDVKRSREKGGTGLGLAIVKHIVNRHQGRLTIESMPGEGSTFTVYLPAARPAGAVTEMS
ncbi:MAG: PAS domain-containing protein [Alphaproteobacteria bacterium]|nr:PAS domain-containing protein [Alphaproteobacteria bacterium]